MKRVMITGATSMIGAALTEECIKKGVEVYAVIRPGSRRRERLVSSPLLHIVECGLEELSTLQMGISVDVFYHIAWGYTSKAGRQDAVLQERNIKYTLDAVQLAERLGCKKFIGAGSQAEYGPTNGTIDEKTAVSPQMAYGAAKYAAYSLSRLLCRQKGMCCVWGRIFSVYGPLDSEETMLKYVITELLDGRKPQVSEGSQKWDYLYSGDAGRAFYLLGKKEVEDGVYCIASGKSRPLREYIMELRDAIDSKLEIGFGELQAGGKPYGISADISKLSDSTGFVPEVSFEEGIREMICQMRKKR